MSLFDSLEIGKTSLAAQQAALQVTGNNITNVNTPGYHRQHAVLEPTPPLHTGIGDLGTGVTVSEVRAARDQFLELRITQSTQDVAMQDAVASYLRQVGTTFRSGDGSIQDGLSRFFNSFSTLATDPTSMPLRYGVLSAAENLASSFREAAQQLEDVQSQANAAAGEAVRQINDLTARIAQLNGQIATAEAGGKEAATLRDERTAAINELASSIDIHYYEADDGTVNVSTAGGASLVTAGFATELRTATQPPNGFIGIFTATQEITDTIRGGKLGGMLEVRDRLIPSYQQELDTLAAAVISQVNAAHAAGADLQTPVSTPALNLFTPPASVAGAASGFAVNSVVAGDLRYIAAGQSGSPGDNANALAIAGLSFQKVLAGGTQTFAESFAALQFGIGTDEQSATLQSNIGNAMLTQLENSRDSYSGVSLDEEATDLIRFQRAYQAAARFVSVIDQLTEELVQTLGR
jgi:flagellar hook-associated protein 1 FlgK